MKYLLFAAVFSFVALPTANLKAFSDPNGTFTITLPETWFLKVEETDGTTEQVFVSVEELKSDSDKFSTGITLVKATNLSATYPNMTDPERIVAKWYAGNKAQSGSFFRYEETSLKEASLAGYKGFKAELLIQTTESEPLAKSVQYTLAKGDNLLLVVAESTVEDWPTYEGALMAGVKSLVVK